jgi:hypothetical protein
VVFAGVKQRKKIEVARPAKKSQQVLVLILSFQSRPFSACVECPVGVLRSIECPVGFGASLPNIGCQLLDVVAAVAAFYTEKRLPAALTAFITISLPPFSLSPLFLSLPLNIFQFSF